jgi:hypothetical protein
MHLTAQSQVQQAANAHTSHHTQKQTREKAQRPAHHADNAMHADNK